MGVAYHQVQHEEEREVLRGALERLRECEGDLEREREARRETEEEKCAIQEMWHRSEAEKEEMKGQIEKLDAEVYELRKVLKLPLVSPCVPYLWGWCVLCVWFISGDVVYYVCVYLVMVCVMCVVFCGLYLVMVCVIVWFIIKLYLVMVCVMCVPFILGSCVYGVCYVCGLSGDGVCYVCGLSGDGVCYVCGLSGDGVCYVWRCSPWWVWHVCHYKFR